MEMTFWLPQAEAALAQVESDDLQRVPEHNGAVAYLTREMA